MYYPSSINLLNGENIEVVNPGELNIHSGPDFFNAMIKFGDIILAGNVEIHINASDWIKHGHNKDKAYDNVILQLVLNRDAEIKRSNGDIIPTAEIRFDKRLYSNYSQLIRNECWIPCQCFITGVEFTVIRQWLNYQAINRLSQKALLLSNILYVNGNCWEESFYQQLARNFGFGLNGGIFEMLARSLPYRLILKHRDNQFQLEAMLFGQAGMLENEKGDFYFESLKKEYQFLKRKYNLKSLEKHLWKFLRLRPANFPTIRIAQFASYLHESPSLFSTILETSDLKRMASFFRVSASEYWDTHFVFNKSSKSIRKATGLCAVNSVLINTVIPLIYFYGQKRKIDHLRERALNFLAELPAESNSIINKWSELGIKAENAFISQALLMQKNELCYFRRCLNCNIGCHIIKQLL